MRKRSAEIKETRNRAENDVIGPRGPGYWLYGLHAAQAAMQNAQRRIYEIAMTREAASFFMRERVTPPITPKFCERSTLDRLLERGAVHQGVALRVEPLPSPTIDEVSGGAGPILVLDQVTDPRNIGAILRSAAAFGAAAVVVQDRNTPQEGGALAKAASGALDIVSVCRCVNLSRALRELKAQGRWVVGLDAGDDVSFNAQSFTDRPIALVLGAEGSGLRRLTREQCDVVARLKMLGEMESLNVSVAAAVALYELSREL